MRTGHNRTDRRKTGLRTEKDRSSRARRLILIVSLIVFAAALCVSLCERTGTPELISPAYVLHNLGLRIRLIIAGLFHLPLYAERKSLIADSPYYLETIARVRILVVTAICGAAMAICGSMFQMVFRNPIAAPMMLGVSSGVDLGLLILVLVYSVDAFAKTTQRYLVCYGLALAVLAVVVLLGNLMGGNRKSSADLLLAGSVVSQIISVVYTYLQFNMEEVDLQTLQMMSMYGFMVNTSYDFAGRSILILLAISAATLLPVFLMRFSFDVLSLPDEEARLLGVRPLIMRVIAILSSTVLMTAVILYCGAVGVLSLAVPHLCRYLFGPRFKNMLAGCALYGAGLLILCRSICSMIYIPNMGTLPIGPLAGVLSAPFLAAAIVQRRRGWD
ncbi:MAG: iron chelate uptake ABC transporter family permease subunit [Anaerovoracaceae bacterium]|jgi:iron complex transport system permease protein